MGEWTIAEWTFVIVSLTLLVAIASFVLGQRPWTRREKIKISKSIGGINVTINTQNGYKEYYISQVMVLK